MSLTPRCRRALEFARETCRQFGAQSLSSDHLIVGLLRLEQGVAVNVLLRRGISIETVEQQIKTRRVAREPMRLEGDLFIGESVDRALQRAEQEAEHCRHSYLGTEHLLLALLAENPGPARDFFQSQSLDSEGLRDLLYQELGASRPSW